MIRRTLLIAALLCPGLAGAQDAQTLADIKQELAVLNTELQGLQRELSTTGGPSVNIQGTGALERIDAMEAELRRLTGATEELTNRIDRVVSDGTNRLGDLQFRLCEIEPDCDFGDLGETATLGGTASPAPAAPAPVTDGASMAIGEQEDFDRAKEALDSGSFRSAADLFDAFTTTYTGGPLSGEAHFLRGQALSEIAAMTEDAAEKQSRQGQSARAYLNAFSGQPEGPRAADALLQLGLTLDTLGQRPDACATLGEVPGRFPGTPQATEAQTARANLSCQ